MPCDLRQQRVKAAFFETHRANFIKNNTDKFSYPQLSGGKIGSKDAWSTENVQSLWSGVMLAGAKAVKWAEVAEQVNEHGPARKPSVSYVGKVQYRVGAESRTATPHRTVRRPGKTQWPATLAVERLETGNASDRSHLMSCGVVSRKELSSLSSSIRRRERERRQKKHLYIRA